MTGCHCIAAGLLALPCAVIAGDSATPACLFLLLAQLRVGSQETQRLDSNKGSFYLFLSVYLRVIKEFPLGFIVVCHI